MKLCKHFGECGGCHFQDVPYKEQLLRKEKRIKESTVFYGIEAELRPINSYEEWFYRNKMEFTFAGDNEVVCGLNNKVSYKGVFNIDECLLFSPDTGKVVNTARDFASRKNYSAYNKFSHKGFLRYLIMRQTKFTPLEKATPTLRRGGRDIHADGGLMPPSAQTVDSVREKSLNGVRERSSLTEFTNETMIGIVTTSIQQLDIKELLKDLMSLELSSPVQSIYWVISDSLSDAVVFEEKKLIYGNSFIREKLDGLSFNIGIDSFFQVNSLGIRSLYEKITNYAELSGKESVLDLFCGGGAIGLFLAGKAKFVWGVELKEEIVQTAWDNAKLNKVENISFFTLDARKFLNSQGSFYKNIDILIVNPPRCGLSKKILRAIVRLNPKKIFYSSCNPDSLFRDSKQLTPYYKIDFVEPFDFFPHTPHIECLSILTKL